jgi:hypothetical protein
MPILALIMGEIFDARFISSTDTSAPKRLIVVENK